MASKKKVGGKKTATKTVKKKTPANAIHMDAVAGDAASVKVVKAAEEAFVKKVYKTKTRTPAQWEALRKRNQARVDKYEKKLAEKLRLKKEAQEQKSKELKDQVRSIAREKGILKASNKESETVIQQQERLRAMIRRSLEERDRMAGTADQEWIEKLDARDKQRIAQAAAQRRAARQGASTHSDPYANAAMEMRNLTEETAADFEPTFRVKKPRYASLAGAGNAADQARRVQKALEKISESPQSKREDKTSSTAPLGDSSKKSSTTSGRKGSKDSSVKVDKKAGTGGPSIESARPMPVVVAPADNSSLFSALTSINKGIAKSQDRIADYLESIARKSSRDSTDKKLDKEQEEIRWSQLLKNTAFDPDNKKSKKDSAIDGVLGKFLSGRMITALKVLSALAAGVATFSVGKKIMHKGKGAGLALQAMIAKATGNDAWLADIQKQQAEHQANDPGGIGMVEGSLAAITALFVGNKIRKGVKFAKTVVNNGRSMAGRVFGRSAVAGGAAGAVEAGAARAATGVAGRGLIKGLIARAGARFAVTQAMGSAVPGVGNTVMAIALAVWTVGDIAWSLMSEETKDKIKVALSNAWEATKEVAGKMGDKIVEWGERAIGYIKDIYNGQELGTNFVKTHASAAAKRNREAMSEGTIINGQITNKGQAHRNAIASVPGYAAAIKAERAAASAKGENWTFDTSQAFRGLQDKAGPVAVAGKGGVIASPETLRQIAPPSNDNSSDSRLRSLLNLIGDAESKGGAFNTTGYDAIWRGAKRFISAPSKPISQMTVGEILGFQRDLINRQKAAGIPAKRRSSAVGKYQMMYSTLSGPEGLIAKLNIPMSAKFDAALQDKLAVALMDSTGKGWSAYERGKIDASTLANTVASKWAAFKNTSGRGQYDAKGFNHASRSADSVIAAVSAPKAPTPVQAKPTTAVPQANLPLPGTKDRIDPIYVPPGGMSPPVSNTPSPAAPVAVHSPSQPASPNRAPGLFNHSYVEDGALQLINYMGIG